MSKWEYKVIQAKNKSEINLMKLANEGWEHYKSVDVFGSGQPRRIWTNYHFRLQVDFSAERCQICAEHDAEYGYQNYLDYLNYLKTISSWRGRCWRIPSFDFKDIFKGPPPTAEELNELIRKQCDDWSNPRPSTSDAIKTIDGWRNVERNGHGHRHYFDNTKKTSGDFVGFVSACGRGFVLWRIGSSKESLFKEWECGECRDYCRKVKPQNKPAKTHVGVIEYVNYINNSRSSGKDDMVLGRIKTYDEKGYIPFSSTVDRKIIDALGYGALRKFKEGETVTYAINNTGTVPRAENVRGVFND